MRWIKLIFWVTVIFLLFMVGLNSYSKVTANDFCEVKGMLYLDVTHQDFFDPKDDVICYKVIDGEVKLFYYER